MAGQRPKVQRHLSVGTQLIYAGDFFPLWPVNWGAWLPILPPAILAMPPRRRGPAIHRQKPKHGALRRRRQLKAARANLA